MKLNGTLLVPEPTPQVLDILATYFCYATREDIIHSLRKGFQPSGSLHIAATEATRAEQLKQQVIELRRALAAQQDLASDLNHELQQERQSLHAARTTLDRMKHGGSGLNLNDYRDWELVRRYRVAAEDVKTQYGNEVSRLTDSLAEVNASLAAANSDLAHLREKHPREVEHIVNLCTTEIVRRDELFYGVIGWMSRHLGKTVTTKLISYLLWLEKQR